MTNTSTYAATRITYDSAHDFARTRARYDEQVPLLDPAASVELVIGDAGWTRSKPPSAFGSAPTASSRWPDSTKVPS